MRSSARSALPVLLTCLCFAASLSAQSPSEQQPVKTPRGSVSGRVTIKDKPAPGVVIGLQKGAVESSTIHSREQSPMLKERIESQAFPPAVT